ALAYGDDRPAADQFFEAGLKELEASWGSGVLMATGSSPTMAQDPRYVAWMARMERLTASPRTAAAMFRATYETDLSAVLPRISSSSFPGLATSRSPATLTGPPPTTVGSRKRSKSSSPVTDRSPQLIEYWPPCCSSTSSTRPTKRPPWATVTGRPSWMASRRQ